MARRQQVATVRLTRPDGRVRWQPVVMGGSVRVEDQEWVTAMEFYRPVKVSRDGLLLLVVPEAPSLITLYPMEIMAGPLRFNRLAKR